MSLSSNSIMRFLSTGLCLAAGAVFWACLDIPDSPENTDMVTATQVAVQQFGESTTDPLKVNSSDTAALVASVTPDSRSNQVRYYWYKDRKLLDSGSHYDITTDMMESVDAIGKYIPNRLVVSDAESNSIEQKFTVIVNAPPQFSPLTEPADGDTLYGNAQTPFTFKWSATDNDASDKLQYYLEIDGIPYDVGEINQVMQSGLVAGEHTFKLTVVDSYGDMDTLSTRQFFVLDTLGAK